MTNPPLRWLPPADVDGADDPWADVDVPAVALTEDQERFLTAFTTEQPALPRVRGVGDPFAPFEEP